MAKARVRDVRILLLKVLLTACALIALALAWAQRASAVEIPALDQLVNAALRSSPDSTEASTAAKPAKPAAQPTVTDAKPVAPTPAPATSSTAATMTPIADP